MGAEVTNFFSNLKLRINKMLESEFEMKICLCNLGPWSNTKCEMNQVSRLINSNYRLN